jgi:hypothetical protein
MQSSFANEVTYFILITFLSGFVALLFSTVRLTRMSEAELDVRLRAIGQLGFVALLARAPVAWLIASVCAVSMAVSLLAYDLSDSLLAATLGLAFFVAWLASTALALIASFRGWPALLVLPQLRKNRL